MEKGKKVSRNYSPEFKICVIMDKLNNKLSRNETVRKYWHTKTKRDTHRYTNRVSDWERIYLTEGAIGLMQKHTSKKSAESTREEPSAKPIEDDLIAENKRLKERNEWLEMEN